MMFTYGVCTAISSAITSKGKTNLEVVKRAVTVVDVLGLMWDAPFYQDWTIAGLKRYIVPPLTLGQYFAFESDGDVMGWFSYALLTERAENALIGGDHIEFEDWNAGDRPWLMDGLAPNGGLPEMVPVMRRAALDAGIPTTLKWRQLTGAGWRVAEINF